MKYTAIAERVAATYKNTPNTIAVLWVGSSSLGIDDSYVDIDLRLITKNQSDIKMMKQFVEENIKVEIEEFPLMWLLDNNDPDYEKYWIRKTSVILYDKKNTLQSLFERANNEYEQNIEQLRWQLFKSIFNSYEVEKCMKRNELSTACMYLYKTLDALTKFIFAYHNKPIPPFKWRIHFIEKNKLYDADKLLKLIPDLQHLNNNLEALKNVENDMRILMMSSGFDKTKVLEPWKY